MDFILGCDDNGSKGMNRQTFILLCTYYSYQTILRLDVQVIFPHQAILRHQLSVLQLYSDIIYLETVSDSKVRGSVPQDCLPLPPSDTSHKSKLSPVLWHTSYKLDLLLGFDQFATAPHRTQENGLLTITDLLKNIKGFKSTVRWRDP